MRETDVNSISISHDKQVVAVGDKLGRVRVFYYPAFYQKQSSLKLENGHVNGVSSILFTPFANLR